MNTPLSPEATQRTLPARYYTDEAVLEAERRLLLDSWQLAGHAAQLPAPGDLLTTEVGGQDIVLVHGHDGAIRAFFNVCPHRGHRLVAEDGNRRVLTCPYHAWSFGLDGTLRGMRRTRTTEAPARAAIGLAEIRLDRLAGFLFVNLSGQAPALAEHAPGLEAQIRAHVPGLAAMVPEDGPALGHSYRCEANWKVLLDNYLECHHCGPAHRSFDDLMRISGSRFALFPNHTFQVAPTAMKADNAAFPLDLEHDVTVGHFWWLFPNTVLGQFPGVPGFYASRLDPVTPDRTERRTLSLIVAEPTDAGMMERHRARSDWSVNVVSREDRSLCESVQRGMRSMGFERGWYVTDPEAHGLSEHAMRHFHSRYLDAIARYAEA
ncbi:ring-hydroxylating oxygenase subunit alpha [Paralimibaculum aggregatum]|uniref:Ring-hydroxylating oxygenase subunit alpha n=1 Tax=Paralimibaculum aggregatum TaxID=3036245 RepID=A0ABQ6LKD8_9RHOB|nr:aromatic ring-hydroxylating dioxygenase subunit alpha [Limibaculum sp. NKW23]GMG82132.1 ring-hydroxylating oxygenase subunit alpha [Limibaculum sp. NKW23]